MKTIGMHIIALFVLLALWSEASLAADSSSLKIEDELSKQNQILRSQGDKRPEGYVIDRSLQAYIEALPPEFGRDLANLKAKDRWLDIGAGEGQAVLDYYNRTDLFGNDKTGAQKGAKAQSVAISIEDRRQPLWHQTAARLAPNQIQYYFNKLMRNYSLSELGKFQVITDVLGGFSYTDELSLFMEKVLELLDVKGSFYGILQDVKSDRGTNPPFYPNSSYLTEIANHDGSEVKVCSWLKSMSCVEVTCELRSNWKPPVEIYRVHKTCDGVKVPGLSKTSFGAGTPPERKFRLK